MSTTQQSHAPQPQPQQSSYHDDKQRIPTPRDGSSGESTVDVMNLPIPGADRLLSTNEDLDSLLLQNNGALSIPSFDKSQINVDDAEKHSDIDSKLLESLNLPLTINNRVNSDPTQGDSTTASASGNNGSGNGGHGHGGHNRTKSAPVRECPPWVERHTSFKSRASPSIILQRCSAALANQHADFLTNTSKYKIKGVAYVNGSIVHFVARIYASNSAATNKQQQQTAESKPAAPATPTSHEKDTQLKSTDSSTSSEVNEYIVEFQKRSGCAMAFNALYRDVIAQITDIYYSNIDGDSALPPLTSLSRAISQMEDEDSEEGSGSDMEGRDSDTSQSSARSPAPRQQRERDVIAADQDLLRAKEHTDTIMEEHPATAADQLQTQAFTRLSSHATTEQLAPELQEQAEGAAAPAPEQPAALVATQTSPQVGSVSSPPAQSYDTTAASKLRHAAVLPTPTPKLTGRAKRAESAAVFGSNRQPTGYGGGFTNNLSPPKSVRRVSAVVDRGLAPSDGVDMSTNVSELSDNTLCSLLSMALSDDNMSAREAVGALSGLPAKVIIDAINSGVCNPDSGECQISMHGLVNALTRALDGTDSQLTRSAAVLLANLSEEPEFSNHVLHTDDQVTSNSTCGGGEGDHICLVDQVFTLLNFPTCFSAKCDTSKGDCGYTGRFPALMLRDIKRQVAKALSNIALIDSSKMLSMMLTAKQYSKVNYRDVLQKYKNSPCADPRLQTFVEQAMQRLNIA